MKMSNHADALREALVRSAGLGDERARRIAGDLADAAGPALQLQTLAIAADLAAEVNRLTDAVHVDVIVTESGADLRVTPLEAEAPGPAEPPPLEPSPPQAGGEETARACARGRRLPQLLDPAGHPLGQPGRPAARRAGAAARLHGPRRFAARLGELSQARALSHTT